MDDNMPSTLNIVLVEDDEFDRLAFRRSFQKAGISHRITECAYADKAFELLRLDASKFDIVVSDYKMPGMNGLELCRKLIEIKIPLPIVMLTGTGSEQLAVEALKAGVDDYVVKDPYQGYLELLPIVIPEVVKKYADRLARKGAEEALQKAHDELERRVDERTAKLQKSEAKYRQLVKNIPNIVYKGYKDGSVEFFNGKIELLTGYDPDEFKSQKIKWYDIIVQEHKEAVRESFIQALKTDKFYNREYKIKTKAGDIHWLQDRGYIVCDNDGEIEYVSGTFIDITQTKNLQDQLVRSERLAATGQLAASVAHEINSPLQGITAYLYSIGQSHKHNKELIEDLDLIKIGFERIRDTVQNLLDFNRPGLETKQSVNLNRIITTTTSLIQSHLKKQKVKINLNLSPAIPEIFGSYQHLGQVFLNLINNAAESIAEISRPASERRERLSCRGLVTLASHYKKNLITIKVSDTGHGISENDIVHIFDPFYTKKKTRGMGIGLSVCYDIIKDHNGTITAENSPEGGAVFTITLPVR